MLLKVEEYILLAKLRAILRKEEEKPEEERDEMKNQIAKVALELAKNTHTSPTAAE